MRLVIVVYISRIPDASNLNLFPPLAQAFREDFSSGDWPYDIGDDPAFFSAQALGGPVTWGVCRQDVRNQLIIGDVVVFFSVTFDEARINGDYKFIGALTVSERIDMTEVFGELSGNRYDQYLNLLVRPSGSGWEHFEPALPSDHWHDDWMWRICDHTGYRKVKFVHSGGNHRQGDPLVAAGSPATFAPNYIVFSADPEQSLVLTDPPLIAAWQRGSEFEEWLDTPVANVIWSLTLAYSHRDHLRTRNRQQPHRQAWADPPYPMDDWFQKLRQATSGLKDP